MKITTTLKMGILLGTTILSTSQFAQAQSTRDVFQDEVIVTATKKSNGENVQDVAIAMTAIGAEQLDALQIRDIAGLGFKMPNVALDDVGTARGTANFSIRGLGVNSSIPSIDPAVGVFVDGMYLGINGGVIFDTFDLESIEVLRGPQGVLFGKNVTGGAVLINTADPQFDFGVKAKAAVESGLRDTGINTYAMASVTGPIIEDMLAAKLAVYYNNDEGWFKSGFDGSNVGKADTLLVRGALKFTPTDNADITLKYEHGTSGGDGSVGQSHRNGSGLDGQIVNFSRDSFGNSNNERGLTDAKWNQLIAEANIDVAFGNGTITNILAWREFYQAGTSDIDATPASLFHADFITEQDQISNELRYAGTFGNADLTTGLFYFSQDLGYDEVRQILGGVIQQFGGGIQDHKTIGAFANVDYHLGDRMTASAGLRYTKDSKDVEISSLFRNLVHPAIPGSNLTGPCSVIGGSCTPDFVDGLSTSNLSPSLTLNYEANENTLVYTSWKRAFRAGGYNFRNTSPAGTPGPFTDEQVDTYEIGFKKDGELGRLNGNVFVTNLSNMQREVNLSSAGSGVVQIIRNTGDAKITGLELDGQMFVNDNIMLEASIGLLNGDYKTLIFDISGDGIINDTDLGLDIPRLSPFTASFGIVADKDLGNLGVLTGRVNYAHRDRSAYTDNNLGVLNAADRIDASLALSMNDGRTRLSLYGKNLSNNVQHGNDTQLPTRLGPVPLAGTYAPLSKGRVVGLELQIDY